MEKVQRKVFEINININNLNIFSIVCTMNIYEYRFDHIDSSSISVMFFLIPELSCLLVQVLEVWKLSKRAAIQFILNNKTKSTH